MKYITDKGTRHSFDVFYKMLFKDFNAKKIFEIGVYMGCGLWFWHEMFPKARLYGIDIKLHDNLKVPKNTKLIVNNIKWLHLNSIPNFDIIVDDGSHKFEDQKYVISNLPSKLNKNGWLIIEDVKGSEVANQLAMLSPEIENTFIVDRQFCRPGQDTNDEFLVIYRNI